METYTTIQVARLVGVASGTFHRWIREKLIEVSLAQIVLGMRVRLWTEADVKKVRDYKRKYYWGQGGRKPRQKKKK